MDVCARCGTGLSEIRAGDPCPKCGSLERGRLVRVQGALGITAAVDASVSIRYNPNRPWQQKWRDVLSGLRQIEQTYGQNDLDNEIVRRQIEDFFKDCREFADWLKHSAGKAEAMNFVATDPDLKLCDALAQTTKHHTRKLKGSIRAWIAEIHGGRGVWAEIEWSDPSGNTNTEDALDLARRCVSAWRRFFGHHQLSPTS